MYAVLDNGNHLIAVHDELEPISEFMNQKEDQSQYRIIDINKKKSKKLSKNLALEDIYLVRYKNLWVQWKLYDSLKNIDDERDYDLKYCRDILFRLLEEEHLSDKEKKSITKVISILEDRIEFIEPVDDKILEESSQMNENFRHSFD